jgi:hypothetical protein
MINVSTIMVWHSVIVISIVLLSVLLCVYHMFPSVNTDITRACLESSLPSFVGWFSYLYSFSINKISYLPIKKKK